MAEDVLRLITVTGQGHGRVQSLKVHLTVTHHFCVHHPSTGGKGPREATDAQGPRREQV